MAVVGLGGLLLLLRHGGRTHDESVEQLLQSMASSLATSFSTYDPRLSRHPIADVAAQLGATDRVVTLEVFDASGKVLWSVHGARRGQSVEPRILALVRSSTGSEAIESGGVAGRPEVVMPLDKRSSCLPCHAQSADPIGGLYLAADRERLLGGSVAYETLAMVLTGLMILFLTALVLLLMNRMVLGPLSRLVRVMAQVEEGDFFARAEVQSNDEIGLLASTFNKLVAKITDLRAERIDTERELHDVRGELELKRQLASTNAKLEERVEQVSFLYALGSELAGVLDPEPLLEKLAQMVHTTLGVPEFAVLLFDGSAARATVAAAVGFPPDTVVAGRPFLLEGSVSAEAAAQRTALYVPDLAGDPRRISYRTQQANRGSLFCVPVIYQDRLLGTFNFAAPSVDAFSADRRELFVAVANQGALALANAQLYRQALELSRVDGLTGIPNRRELDARLALEWSHAERHGEPLSVVMIDVDAIKKYNDDHTRQRGDEALRRVARILELNIRKVDAVGRWGGDEFLVILPRTTSEQALLVAEKLRRSVEQADFEGGYLQPLGRFTITLGVATAPEHAAALEALLHAADDALFAAKDAGKNRVAAAKPR